MHTYVMGPGRFLAACAAILLTTGLFSCVSANAATLYVSPEGNDGWSGRSPRIAAADGPFATLERAQAEVRRVVADGPPRGGVTVFVRGGTYELTAPFTLGPEDSGAPGSPVV